ncbi:hypothetical protein EB796_020354 [Bugula neritina]|uniref:Uncharacterized protein n=1 Tax=Bugula neritina TaxID=10212 RepID=A0A7J7J7D2_BUGNE|nr:hypothetical protein EB796_020354 [Bugula neritina]
MNFLSDFTTQGSLLRYVVADDYIKGNYIIVWGHSICTTSDFITLENITGSLDQNAYAQGPPGRARFDTITGVVTNPTSNKQIWVSDYGNSCIRTVNRETGFTNVLTGRCREKTVQDGTINSAGVAYPFGMAVSPSDRQKVYFYENGEGSIRCILRIGPSWYLRTVLGLRKKISGLNFDPAGKFLYLSYETSIVRVPTTWENPSQEISIDFIDSIAEDIISGVGHEDGPLESARMKDPMHIIFLDETTFLFADYNNHVLRMVDLLNSSISTICVPQGTDYNVTEGAIDTCRIELPRQIVQSKESSKLYILGDYRFHELTYSGEFLSLV